jgi:hypothetical protein
MATSTERDNVLPGSWPAERLPDSQKDFAPLTSLIFLSPKLGSQCNWCPKRSAVCSKPKSTAKTCPAPWQIEKWPSGQQPRSYSCIDQLALTWPLCPSAFLRWNNTWHNLPLSCYTKESIHNNKIKWTGSEKSLRSHFRFKCFRI